MALAILLVVGGLVILAVGGEVVVRSASSVAAGLGMSRLVIGLTVVSLATSMPELIVTLEAVLAGSTGLAVGNVVGSNIANILLVLGLAATITGLTVRSSVLKLDIPVMIGFSVIVTVMAWAGQLAVWQGVLLVVLLVGYLVLAINFKRHDPETPGSQPAPPAETQPKRNLRRILLNLTLLVVAVAVLVAGAAILIQGATTLARTWGLSDVVIGLTIVAVGTSAPEIATAIVASLRGARDLAVGNAVGSNIFNIGAVLGLGATFAPGGIPVTQAAYFDLALMTIVAVLLYPVARTGKVINRWEGWAFLGYYVAYLVFLLLAATNPGARDTFAVVMLAVVIPVTLVVAVLAYWRHQINTPNAWPSQNPDP